MKNLIIIFIVVIAASACKTVNQSADQPNFEETRWKLVAMNKKPVDGAINAYIQFKDDKAAGRSACNSFSAEYVKVNSKVSFEGLISTKMYCEGLMDQENQMITNLSKVKRFDIRYGLLYLYGSDDLLLTFKK